MSHHLCLVSAQPMPNYLPLKASEITPSEVTLAVTNKMKKQGERLKTELTKHGIKVNEWPLDVEGDAFDKLPDRFIQWVEAHENEDIVLNVTGGTKPMAIAAQEAFRMAGKPVFYVDVDSDKVWWLDSGLSNPEWSVKCNISESITTPTYLKLHGVTLESGEQEFINKNWLSFARELAKKAKDRNFSYLLGRLNFLAMEAEKRSSLEAGGTEYSEEEWLKLMESLFSFKITRDKKRLAFCSTEARIFANGGWLEAYLFHYLKEIVPKRKTTYLNAILTGENGERNEIDVLTQARNQLFVFECKTRNFSNYDSAADALYKLLAIGSPMNLGLRTNNVFVTYRDLNPWDKKRADSFGIKIIGAIDLSPEHIETKLGSILRV